MLVNKGSVAVSGTDKTILGNNMKRKGVMISANSATYTGVNFGASATDGSGQIVGFPCQNTVPPLTMTDEHIGDSIREEIHACAAAGTVTVTFMEFLGP